MIDDAARQALSEGPSDVQRTRQRARFVAEARGGQRRFYRELAVGLVAAGLGGVLVFSLWQPRASGLEVPVLEGNAFVFNEQSHVTLQPGAKAHVERAKGREVVVVLESGELQCSITSGLKNVWRFRAGPNEVVVRGTKFSVLWRPQDEALDVSVSEGKVEVRTADGKLQFVTAGAQLAWKKTAEEPPVVQLEEPSVREPVAAPKPRPVVVAKAQPQLRDLMPEWKRLAEAGKYAKAVALVEEQGVEGAMAGVSSDDLLLFADAARLTKRADLGRAVLGQVRTRFKGSGDATEAAFRLGRLEFDAQRLSEAGGWFDTYVKEAPDGPFATEAMGRRLDAWQRLKDSRVGSAATEYLEKYPRGAYAPLARQVLGGL
jgi:hypothetical protein